MELALSVMGQMASRSEQWKTAGFFGLNFKRGLEAPKLFLVHRYLDRCGMADVARGSRDRKRVGSRRSTWRGHGERGCFGHAGIGRGDGHRSGASHRAGAHCERRAAGSRSHSHAGRHASRPVAAGKQYLRAASGSWPAQCHRASGGLRTTSHTRGIHGQRRERWKGLRHHRE